MIKPVSQKVKSKISTLSDGVAFASNSFTFVNANKNSIEKELSKLNSEGVIRRLRKGIYYKPRKSSINETELSVTSIAQAIAKFNKAHLLPEGTMALNLLGLSDKKPSKHVYLNDKLHKSERIGNIEIVFKRVNSKKLMASNKKAGLVLSAIEYLGKNAFKKESLVSDFAKKLEYKDIKDLDRASKGYSCWVQQIVRDIIAVINITFDPKVYSYNLFWQTSEKSEQKVYSIISNYLSSMNTDDIKILCKQFGKNIVESVLEDKYKKMYEIGYISTNGMDIPLNGKYNKNEMYRRLLGVINDC